MWSTRNWHSLGYLLLRGVRQSSVRRFLKPRSLVLFIDDILDSPPHKLPLDHLLDEHGAAHSKQVYPEPSAALHQPIAQPCCQGRLHKQTYRPNKRHFACRLRSLPSGSWRLRPPVAACSAAASGVAEEGTPQVPRARPVQCCAARGVPQRTLSPCCCCEDSSSGTPRARATAAGGFRRLRAGPLFELTPTLKGASKGAPGVTGRKFTVRCK